MQDPFEQQYDKARRLFADGHPEHALVPATEAAKLAPGRWDARLLLARIWLAQGGSARAIADARAAIELANGAMPEESMRHAREVVALASLQSDDFDTAEKELAALAASGHGASLARLLVHLVERGRADDARTAATEHAGANPSLEGALATLSATITGDDRSAMQLALGELAIAAGALKEAQDRFRAVLAEDPEDARAIDGLQRAMAGGSVASATQGDFAMMLRWGSTLFVAFGIATFVFSFWRRELIEVNSRFPPIYWTGAGVATFFFGVGLVALSRNLESK